jgi:ABC-2 type transport system permease protein
VISDIIPFVIIALTVILVLRRYRGAGRPRARTAAPVNATGTSTLPELRLLPLPGDIGLVAARELRERARSRAFRTGTVLLLAGVAAALVVPALLGGKQSTQRVGVVGPLSAGVRAAVTADGAAAGTAVSLVAEPGAAAASADLRAGRISVAIVDGREVLTDKALTVSDTSPAAQLARAAARSAGTGAALQAAGLTPAQAAVVAGARPAAMSSLQPAGPGAGARNTSLVGLLLLFFMLTQYNAWTLTGVLEEKSSRVVEVLLAAVSPARLLAGKVLGIGLAAFVQAGVTVGVAVGLARAAHSDVLTGLAPLTVAATVSWLILGYAFYSWVYAAAGSTADRQEQAQSLLLPLGLPVIFGYVVSLAAATSGNPSLLVHVLAYLPPTAPLAMPVLVSLGAVTWWQFTLSAVASIACTVAVARVAIGVYRASILRTGRRAALRELFSRRPARGGEAGPDDRGGRGGLALQARRE